MADSAQAISGRNPAVGAPLAAASPFEIANLRLANRLVAAAHATAAVVDGAPTTADAAYWRRLARGGVSMVITGGTVVARESTIRQRYLTEAWRPEIRDALRRRAQAITSSGAVAIAQLVHLGRETLGAASHYAPVSAGAVRSPREPTAPFPMTTAEIRRVVDQFRMSAANAVSAGFHGVELSAGHGYLLAQFLSRATNTRTDEYGGSPDRRIALLSQVIDAVRAEIGAAPIGVRVSVEGGAESGLDLDDLLDLLPRLHNASRFDYLNVTTGVRNSYVQGMATTSPPLLASVDRLRAALDVPLLVSQSFRTTADIEAALRSGADLVGVARALIADPDFPKKVLAGAERSVRPCTACNEDCRTFEPTALCTVNPELAPPGLTVRPASPLLLSRARVSGGAGVAVVGAGPAGMECALNLGRNGVPVTVFEHADEVGGQLRSAGSAPWRSEWRRFVDYQCAQVHDTGARLVLGHAPAGSDLAEHSHVVLATGAEETGARIAGEVAPIPSTDFLARAGKLTRRGGTVAVLDDGFGWWSGIGAVEAALAAGAREVLMITPGAGFASGLSLENRTQLLQRLAGAALRIIPLTTVTGGTGHRLTLTSLLDGRKSYVEADVLVVVGERRPRKYHHAAAAQQTVRAIGDCVVPRRLSHAVAEGRAAAEAILAELGLTAPVPS
ncbi:2,4-dienoyl-CoA reductase (NADPH2) [Saccharopolyspora erythraea NRRL 2338]|uniref:2,4-dienoyl-CoA reductase n=2 Tax=Saccharopolyspora erythraea TaxID=1836 RepID=A4FDB3_SACEN|nr:FAD-dependent oxidoreductase [Saccharopolyspora erythraea]PFG95781.1 2,4-dienoyl-CoA reductase (NADPH2) [Saccharopolyspora erythraea NRRL 2338]QRK92368.1 NAD(P)-binding protein [Saccharopolyspora erythraea]CAM02038.1 2,4-dienoyl-CoA reductase [Saccharopolyspora erythraea NRRL 2338]